MTIGGAVGIALVGCGGMGIRHLLGYAALERAQISPAHLVAVCDQDPSRATAAAKRYQALCGRAPRVLEGLASVLADPAVDAVDLVLPTSRHHEAATTALEHGRHVLVEKPFGITIRACRVMAEAAARSHQRLGVAENYRRVVSHRALHALVTEGVIGRPYVVSVHTVQQAEESLGWFRDRSTVGSLPNLEFAVHEADLLRHLFGEVAEVHAIVGEIESAGEDVGLALLRFQSGTLGQWMVLTAGHGGPRGGRLVAGELGQVDSRRWEGWENGSLRLDGSDPVPSEAWIQAWLAGLEPERRERLLPRGTWDEVALTVDIQDPLRYGIATELYDFATAVAAGREPEVDAESATRTVAICLAILESAQARGPVAVADVLEGRVRDWQDDIDRALGLG